MEMILVCKYKKKVRYFKAGDERYIITLKEHMDVEEFVNTFMKEHEHDNVYIHVGINKQKYGVHNICIKQCTSLDEYSQEEYSCVNLYDPNKILEKIDINMPYTTKHDYGLYNIINKNIVRKKIRIEKYNYNNEYHVYLYITEYRNIKRSIENV